MLNIGKKYVKKFVYICPERIEAIGKKYFKKFVYINKHYALNPGVFVKKYLHMTV